MKVLLAYDCLYAFLMQKGSDNDVAQTITLLRHMGASIYVDGYANVLLYLDGLIEQANSHALKGMFLLPPINKDNFSEDMRNDIISYANRLSNENTYLFWKERQTEERKLLLQICRHSQLSQFNRQKVDNIISNDPMLLVLSYKQGLATRIYSTENFMERIHIDHPEYSLPRELKIKEIMFGDIDVNQIFFDSYREEYEEFDEWFAKKSKEMATAYIATIDGKVKAFLALKVEKEDENYNDITPLMPPNRRLKICSFKVGVCGYRLSERFMMIVFKEAMEQRCNEIYVTIFDTYENRRNLMFLLCNRWGFVNYGKNTRGEQVLTRKFVKFVTNKYRQCYPFARRPQYLIILSLLSKEILEFQGGYIRQMLVLFEQSEEFNRGSIMFIRNSHTGKLIFSAVVEDVIREISDEQKFVDSCKKRSIYTEKRLREIWNKNNKRPYLVKILHQCDFCEEDAILFQKRLQSLPMSDLLVLSQETFNDIIKDTKYGKNFIAY